MKKARPTPSPALTEVNQYLDKRSEQFMKAMDKAWANRHPFPYGHRGPVYIWLWENRAAVTHAMEVHWLSWDSLALGASRPPATRCAGCGCECARSLRSGRRASGWRR